MSDRATVEDTEPLKGLHATHLWQPFLHVGDGYKAVGYRRADGAGYILPEFDEGAWALNGRWWATWAHPMKGGRPGWHHHAFGTYSSAQAAAFAFDTVYELERIAGNTDRCPKAKESGS